MTLCDTPEAAAAYWRLHVPTTEAFDPECECFTVLLLNTRRRIKAHHLVSVGTHDTLLAWYRQGATLAAKLPLLSTYLGHSTITGTEIYLHATAQLLESAGQRFHAHFAIPTRGQLKRHHDKA
jgi:hypothetical protein